MSTPDTNAYGVKTRHTKTIGGVAFTTDLYMAGQALDVLPMLTAVASGPGALALDVLRAIARDGGIAQADVTGAELRDSILALSEQVIKAGGSARVRELLSSTHTRVQGQPALIPVGDEFDALFQGRVWLAIEVLAWVIGVNFNPFSGAGRPQASPGYWMGQLKTLLKELTPTPSDSTSPPAAGSSRGFSKSEASPRARSESDGPSTTS